MKKLLTVILIVLAPFIGLVGVWLFTLLYDPAPAQDHCVFNSVNESEFQQFLTQAKEQGWRVWPGLSDGIFWPSNQDTSPTPPHDKVTSEKLLSFVQRLTGKNPSGHEQLAAAHAVMRSMHAEYIWAVDIPDLSQHGAVLSSTVQFMYFMPAIRFAPLCFVCLVWWPTTIGVVFSHDLASDSYQLDYFNLLHSGLKYTPKKVRNVSEPCPSFPRNRK